MRSLLTPEAASDLGSAARYYESERPGLGRFFLDDYRATRRFVEAFPEGAPEVPGLGARRKLFRRFRHALFYTARKDRLLILRVLHTAQRPEDWPRG